MYKCPNCQHEFEIEQVELKSNCPQCGQPVGSSGTIDLSDGYTVDSSDEEFDLEVGSIEAMESGEKLELDDSVELVSKSEANVQGSTESSAEELFVQADDETASLSDEDDEFESQVATEIYNPDENQPTIEVGDGDRSTAVMDYAERMIAGLGERLDGDADYVVAMDDEDSELGSGASGIVYKATQKSLDRVVAIKLLKKQVQADTQQNRKTVAKQKDVEKFLYESQITAGLDHPNVITVHDLGVTANDTLFYSMKMFEGGRDWSKDFDQNSLEQNLDIFNDVCDAIRRAHRDRIVHRDLKPQNVLVGDFGEVQVTDWGLAIDLRRQQNDPFSGGGTPCYMAPEMALHYLVQQEAKNLKTKREVALENSDEDSQEVELIRQRIGENELKEQKYRLQISELSDIYVLGGILFQIASGYPPHLFQISDAQRKQWGGQTSRNKVRRELEMAATREVAKYIVRGLTNPEAREALRDIALRAMAAKPADRYQSVAELQQAVREFRNFMRCIEDTQRGNREVEGSQTNSKSYVKLTNAIYAYEAALVDYPEYEPAREGQAKAKFLFAERALNNQDFELGLSTMTEDAIEDQPDVVVASKLRKELIAQRNRRDRRKKLLFFATMASLASIVIGIIFGAFAILARNHAIEQEARAESKKLEANQAELRQQEAESRQQEAESREQEAKTELGISYNALLTAKKEAVKSKVDAEINNRRLANQEQKISSAEIGEEIANLGAQAATIQSEACLLYTSPSPRDATLSRMPSSA